MKHGVVSGKRRPVNLSIDTGVVETARALGINLSQVSEASLLAAIKIERERRWLEENREAIQSFNEWYALEGDPLAQFRVR